MKNETILLKIEPKMKIKLMEICRRERRSMTAVILLLIDGKIQGEKNGRKK